MSIEEISNIRKLRIRLAVTGIAVTKEVSLQTVGGGAKQFIFPFAPIEVSYDSLAPEWVSIDRPLLTPIIDLKGYNLLRVSLRFLLAVPYDGITTSIDNEIRTLRSIANSSNPCAFINMDKMLTNPFNVPRTGYSRPNKGFFFRVAEMSVSSLRRNLNNEITSAEVSLTLQETANPPIRAVYFAPINYSSGSTPSSVGSKSGYQFSPTDLDNARRNTNIQTLAQLGASLSF